MCYVSHRRRQLMMPKISPIGHTALATQSEPTQQEQLKENLQRAPVWCRPNTLRRSSQNSSHNSRVLERVNYAYLDLRRCQVFYSSRELAFPSWSRSLFHMGLLLQTLLSVMSKDFLIEKIYFQRAYLLESPLYSDFHFGISGLFQVMSNKDLGSWALMCLSAMGLQSAQDHLYTGPTVPFRQAH